MCTYNLAFFFGPGFPLGFGSPSGPNAPGADLFGPFFLTPSVGGGINAEPLGIGVLVFDSAGFSGEMMGATEGIVAESVESEPFDGESSLISLTSFNS